VQQGIRQVTWTQAQGMQGGAPKQVIQQVQMDSQMPQGTQKQVIQLDPQTHAQLTRMDPTQKMMFLQRIHQRQMALQRQHQVFFTT